MAGAGYKLFNTGDVLTAAQVNTYLMEQTVMRFATTTARDTALSGVLAEGMICYIDADNNLYKYTGSAWVNIDSGSTSPLTTKGDLYTYSTSDARLAVGNNGDTLVADSSATTGLRWQEPKSQNVILNSSFDVWQRGTSFTGTSPYYTADRWVGVRTGAAAGGTWSRQTASLTGFNYSMRTQRNSGNTSTNVLYLGYSLESADSFALAGKTVVLSFWAKAGANYSPTSSAMKTEIATGTGTDQQKYVAGFTGDATSTTTHTLTTSWQRFSATATLSASGTEVAIGFYMEPTGTASTNDWFEVTGVQLEIGSVATPYRRYSSTLAGELAACQRYYYQRLGANEVSWENYSATGTFPIITFTHPVEMRIAPTVTITGTFTRAGLSGNPTVHTGVAYKQLVNLTVTANAAAGRAYFYSDAASGYTASAEL